MKNAEQQLDRGIQKMLETEIELPNVVRDRISQTLANLPNVERVTKPVPKSKRRKWWIGSITAASLLVGSFVTTYKVSADFKAYVDRLFAVTSDKGYENAQIKQVIQAMNLSATDQGYTIEVKEALADGNRISLVYQIKNAQGEIMPYFAFATEPNPEVGLDAMLEAKLIDPKTKKEIPVDMTSNDSIDQNAKEKAELLLGPGLLGLESQTEIPDGALLELKVKWLYVKGGAYEPKLPTINAKGNWTLRIPVDTSKAKAQQQVSTSGDKLVIPQGELSVKQLDNRVSNAKLELLFKGKDGYQVGRGDGYMAEFELYDDKNKLIYSTNDPRFVRMEGGAGGGPDFIQQEFQMLPKSSSYRLHVKAIWLSEKVNQTFPYNGPVLIDGIPVQLEKPYQEEVDNSIRIRLSGDFPQDYSQIRAYFLDASGKKIGYEPQPGRIDHNRQKIELFTDLPNTETIPSSIVIDSITKRVPVNWETKIVPQPVK